MRYLLFLLPLQAFALTTQYLSFDHPEGWQCELSQGVWICQDTVEPQRKESLVLSIATTQSDWDSLENFEKYLKDTRKTQDDAGKTIESKITYTRKRNINGNWWVDSLQFNSELPGFWTRYVATVHKKLAILITYVASDEYYKTMGPKFERMVTSLKLNSDFDLTVATKQGDGPLPGAEILGPRQQKDLLKGRLNMKSKKKEVPESRNLPLSLLLVGVLGVAVFLFLKRKKKSAQQRENTIRRTG